MKTKFFLLAVITILITNMGLQAQTSSASKKILVVYFSYSGNTRVIAEQIKNETGGDIFEIKPVKDYPADYNAVVDQAKSEINAGYKPALKTKITNIESYDVIFVGSPNWWSAIAPPVATFLSSYNLQGKTIVPFMTHGSGGIGHGVLDIKKLCPKSTFLEGFSISGSSVNNAKEEVKRWLRGIKMIK